MPNIAIHNLIPGHVYKEQTGTELVFIGFGTYKRYVNHTKDFNWGNPNPKFLYLKKNDIIAKLSDGRLSKDLSVYDGHATGKIGVVPDFFKTVFFSDKPPIVIEDLGKLFPAEMFKNWTVKDITFDEEIYWSVQTGEMP